jgi:hypothetical protein
VELWREIFVETQPSYSSTGPQTRSTATVEGV